MSPDQIRDELRSYGLDPSSYRSKDELLKALRMARVKGNSNFSALGPNARKAPGRSHSADDVQLFGNPEDSSSPRSSSNSKRSRRARSNSNDRPLITESNVNKFSEGQIVYYTSSDGKNERAKILKIHLDDALVPFYDIRLTESGKEKQTDDAHLSRLTDQLFSTDSSPPESTSTADVSTGTNQVQKQSRFVENQVVYYTNNGENEKAKILSIHLDDELIPFYDIRLVESGTEKQTTDSRLSSLTDDLFKAAAQGRVRSESVGSELPVSPQRKLPGRSRSMGSSDAVPSLSPGPLKKGRRPDRRPQSSKLISGATVSAEPPALASPTSDDSQMPNRGNSRAQTDKKSRFMENQVVYYSSNGQKEKAKILKIHLDDELVPFYDIRLLESGKEKQTTDSHISSLTDDSFKTSGQSEGRDRSITQAHGQVRRGSVGPGLHIPPERKLPGRSRSFDAASVAGAAVSQSPGPLKKGRRVGRRQSLGGAPQDSASNIANIKKGLARYGVMSPSCYNYANDGEMREAWKVIEADSKLSVGRLKKELRDLGHSTEYIEKNEMIGGLCKARLDRKAGRIDKLGGSGGAAEGSSPGGPARKKMQRRSSDGPLSMLKKGKRRGARGK
ncbi:MAG: hypothetical protein SGBAC_007144 [Bacillariaceae sp.]